MILFGQPRPGLRATTLEWSVPGLVSPALPAAIPDALVNLLGYPHGADRQLAQDFGLSRAEIAQVFTRWQAR